MSTSTNTTIDGLKALPIWVAWQTEPRRPGGRITKVPYSPSGRRAKANSPGTWGTHDDALAMAENLAKPFGLGGIGIEFTTLDGGRSGGGIDLDSCRNPETGHIDDWAQEIIDAFASYTEISPSGTGVKVYFTYCTADLLRLRGAMGSDYGKMFKREGGDHPPAIELHLGNRFFAFTGERLDGSGVELRHIDTEVILNLINVTGPAFADADPAATAAQDTDDSGKKRGKSDRSRSGVAFRKGRELRRSGATYEEMVAALRADPELTDWVREKGEANGQRELKRIWEKAEASGPVIQVEPGRYHTNATAAEDAIIVAGLPIFQRGDTLVKPIAREVPAAHGRMTIAAGLGELNVYNMLDAMSQTAEYEKYDARAEGWVRANPTKDLANILLYRRGEWQFPVVRGIITTPTLRPDGTVITAAGYDPATKLYYVEDTSLKLCPAVSEPSRVAAENALKALSQLLDEFPFVDAVSKAVALSALITPIVRGALMVAPLHLFRASTPGSGKSYLADIASAICTGRECPVITAAAEETETEKRLAGELLAGNPLISIDNVNGELGGDLLCQAVERPMIRIRVLGGLDNVEVPSTATVLATGNNARVRADMVRRTIIAGLDAKVERPELRQFKGNPVAAVLTDRGQFVSACLIIVRAYIKAGTPNAPSPLASFEDWSTLVRGALMWLGCADPVQSMEEARKDDPELTELREVMAAWEASLNTRALTVKDVVTTIDARAPDEFGDGKLLHPELHEAIHRLFGERGTVNTRRFGNWLSAKEGRIIGDRRLKRSNQTGPGGVAKWFIEVIGR